MTFGENAVKVLTLMFGYDIYQLSPSLVLGRKSPFSLSGRQKGGDIMDATFVICLLIGFMIIFSFGTRGKL